MLTVSISQTYDQQVDELVPGVSSKVFGMSELSACASLCYGTSQTLTEICDVDQIRRLFKLYDRQVES